MYVPSLAAVVTGDLVYNQVHMMTAETGEAEREQWIANLDKVAALVACPSCGRDGHNGLVSAPTPGFELGTDGPSLILVGVDGSRTSLRAAAYAGGLARRQGCRLLAVYVGRISASASMAPAGAAVMSQTFEQIADELKQLMLSRTAETGIAAEFRSVLGDPLAELTTIAEQTHADAVVVGASEHLGHRIVGSLASRLVRAGKWPVIVVP